VRASEATIIALDFETTGAVGGLPVEAWQIGMVKLVGGVVDATQSFEGLLRVGDRPFNPYAPGSHHRVREQLEQAPSLQQLWPELSRWWLAQPLAAHNVAVEQKFVRESAPLHRTGPWIDTLKLARWAYPDLPSHTLEDLIAGLGLTRRLQELCPDRAAHDALYDAFACAVLLEHLLQLPGWESVSVDALAAAHPGKFYLRTDYHRRGHRGPQRSD